MAPGTAADVIAHGAQRDALEVAWGYRDPLLLRLGQRLLDVVTFNLGTSRTLSPGAPVSDLLFNPLARTTTLVVAAVGLLVVSAVVSALRATGRGAMHHVQTLFTLPHFVAAHLCVNGLNQVAWWAAERGLIDRPGWFPLPLEVSTLRFVIAVTVVAWASGAFGETRDVFSDAVQTIRVSPFVDAARARGQSVRLIEWHHLVPVVADVVARRIPIAFGAVVFVDPLLQLGGLGNLLWRATEERDLDVAFAIVTMIATWVAATRLASDLIALAVDPRLRTAS